MRENKKEKRSNLLIITIAVQFLLAAFFLFSGPAISKHQEEEKASITKQFKNNFNETFRGVVIDTRYIKDQPKPQFAQKIVKIELDFSTTSHYDPRGSSYGYFFCVIDFPIAELLIDGYFFPQVGDTLLYDGINDIYHIKRDTIWSSNVPDIVNLNNSYLKRYLTIPRYNEHQLKKRLKMYPNPLERPNDYYMLMFAKYRKKEKLLEAYNKLSNYTKYEKRIIPKYFEKRHGYFYYFLSNSRYWNYKEVYKAWKEAGYSELHIAKFDKHNRFIKVLEKQRNNDNKQ